MNNKTVAQLVNGGKMRLEFIGFQEDGQGGKFQMWNVFNSPKPWINPDGSTISKETVNELLRTCNDIVKIDA